MTIPAVNWDRPRKRALGAVCLSCCGGWSHLSPKGGDRMMLITVTFYVKEWAFTIQVKCRNRHSDK